MDIKEQVQGLFRTAVEEMKRQSLSLHELVHTTFPPVPRPRSSIRCITAKLGVLWNADHINRDAIIFYERFPSITPRHRNFKHKMYWVQTSESDFIANLFLTCTTPRLAARALARIDSYTRWLVNREEGVKKARENIMTTQKPWVECLNARIGGAELAGVSLLRRKLLLSSKDSLSTWPPELREALARKDHLAIKMAREIGIGNMSLADAHNLVKHRRH